MWQKIIVGALALTVIGAVGVGVYDATRTDEDPTAVEVLATPPNDEAAIAEEADATTTENAPADVMATSGVPTTSQPADAPLMPDPAEIAAMVGDAWEGTGVILAFDEAGMSVQLTDGTEVYIELGPPFAWQEAGVSLAVGDEVRVQGFFNGEQYHAASVTKANGETLQLRTEEGMPIWAEDPEFAAKMQEAGMLGAEMSVPADAWVTLEGTVTSFQGATLEMLTSAGKTLVLNLGQARFVESQGINFVQGDTIAVLGFWQNETFRAGEITKLETGERLMLLDPNGRPLWGGPGRGGAGGGHGYQGGNNADASAGGAN